MKTLQCNNIYIKDPLLSPPSYVFYLNSLILVISLDTIPLKNVQFRRSRQTKKPLCGITATGAFYKCFHWITFETLDD